MKKVYQTPEMSVTNIETIQFLAHSDDWISSKKYKGTNFGEGSGFQTDKSFGGQKSPWEEND